MIKQRMGVVLESLRLKIRDGMKAASSLGFHGIQISSTQKELMPENLSQTGRRELRRLINIQKLQLCAIGGESGSGFVNENEFDFSIKRVKEIVNLALDLQTKIVTIHIGSLPTDPDSSHGSMVRSALNEIGTHAENYGCCLAAKAPFDCASTLKKFLLSLETGGIKLTYDPASLIMNNLDPVKSILELHEYVAHTNIWDVRQAGEGRQREVPIGEGIVPVREFVSTLDAVGYEGFYMISSNAFEQPVEMIRRGKEFLVSM
ncbi:MAG: sugar phosphate isomerase/epimerase [Planctomycetes bacterium]|nr:sugar phosphate isomerase/epimerase [Planctomycetota bacterium]